MLSGDDTSYLPNARRIAVLADTKKAKDIRAYDVRGLTLIADAFVMCSATSEPQMKAVLNAIQAGMKDIGVPPLHVEGSFHADWLVLDYGAVIAHIFRPEARAFYDLDSMWADAPLIDVDLDGTGKAD
jgi:ribosome-associated protein